MLFLFFFNDLFFLASKKAMKQLLCKNICNEIILQLLVAVGTVALGQNQ
jgi:hypothetical protein